MIYLIYGIYGAVDFSVLGRFLTRQFVTTDGRRGDLSRMMPSFYFPCSDPGSNDGLWHEWW